MTLRLLTFETLLSRVADFSWSRRRWHKKDCLTDDHRMESRCADMDVGMSGPHLNFACSQLFRFAWGAWAVADRISLSRRELRLHEFGNGAAFDDVKPARLIRRPKATNGKLNQCYRISNNIQEIREVNCWCSEDAPKPAIRARIQPISAAIHSTCPERVTRIGVNARQPADLAVENNPTLSQAQVAIRANRNLPQAGLYPNPQIGYELRRNEPFGETIAAPSARVRDRPQASIGSTISLVEINVTSGTLESQRLRILNDLKIVTMKCWGAQQAVIHRNGPGSRKRASRWPGQFEEMKHGTKAMPKQSPLESVSLTATRPSSLPGCGLNWQLLASRLINPVQFWGTVRRRYNRLEACQQILLANSPQIRSTECDLVTPVRIAACRCEPITVQNVTDYDRATQAATFSTLVAFPSHQ